MEYRLDKFEESLIIKFTNLEVLMAGLEAQGSAVDNLTSLGYQ